MVLVYSLNISTDGRLIKDKERMLRPKVFVAVKRQGQFINRKGH